MAISSKAKQENDPQSISIIGSPVVSESGSKAAIKRNETASSKTIVDPVQPDQLNILKTQSSLTIDASKNPNTQSALEGLVDGQRQAIRSIIYKALDEAREINGEPSRPVYVHLQHQIHVEIINNRIPAAPPMPAKNDDFSKSSQESTEEEVYCCGWKC